MNEIPTLLIQHLNQRRCAVQETIDAIANEMRVQGERVQSLIEERGRIHTLLALYPCAEEPAPTKLSLSECVDTILREDSPQSVARIRRVLEIQGHRIPHATLYDLLMRGLKRGQYRRNRGSYPHAWQLADVTEETV